jgi:Ca2+-binding RTX toxin-like protein
MAFTFVKSLLGTTTATPVAFTAPVTNFGGLAADPEPDHLPSSDPDIPVTPTRVQDEPVVFIGHANNYIQGSDADELIIGKGDFFNFGGSDWIDAGGGNDTVTAGPGDDMVRGGAGNDKLMGGSGNDQIAGGLDNDRIEGGPGNDRLFGEQGSDTLIGGDGNDFMSGGSGNDVLEGWMGNDTLIGGFGTDLLKGAEGKDLLIGGFGGDTMIGGEDADIFRFESVQDSLRLDGRFDTITDFQKGTDKIDLSQIDANELVAGNQAFSYVSYGGTGQILAAGQMTAHYDLASNRTIIEANIDGDNTNEFHLELVGNVVPSSGDFML